MRRYVKNHIEYLTEALNKTEWMNYKNDTALNAPNPSADITETAALIQKLLNVDDPVKILFTGDEVSIGGDYKYFIDSVIPKSQVKENETYPSTSYSAFYTLYQLNDKFFIKTDIKDTYEYSYIFIKEEDYDFFNKLDNPTVPPPPEQTQPAQTQAQAAPTPQADTGTATLV